MKNNNYKLFKNEIINRIEDPKNHDFEIKYKDIEFSYISVITDKTLTFNINGLKRLSEIDQLYVLVHEYARILRKEKGFMNSIVASVQRPNAVDHLAYNLIKKSASLFDKIKADVNYNKTVFRRIVEKVEIMDSAGKRLHD